MRLVGFGGGCVRRLGDGVGAARRGEEEALGGEDGGEIRRGEVGV